MLAAIARYEHRLLLTSLLLWLSDGDTVECGPQSGTILRLTIPQSATCILHSILTHVLSCDRPYSVRLTESCRVAMRLARILDCLVGRVVQLYSCT